MSAETPRLRRTRSVVLLVFGATLVFVPFATASNGDRAAQTLTLLSLTLSFSVAAVVWWALVRVLPRSSAAPNDYRPSILGLAILAGSLSALPFLGVIDDFADAPSGLLEWQLVGIAAFFGVGGWCLVLAVRGLFPAGARGLGAAAIAILFFGLAPGPILLVQPSADALKIADFSVQLRAGFLYWTVGAALLVAPFLALTTLPGDWFERWWRRATERVMAVPNVVFVGGLVLVALAVTLVITFYSFDGRPTTADAIAQLWHARILLSGRLSLPPDPNPEFFAIDNVIDSPRWMSQFPIGGPAVLALGLALGAAWLVNPVLTALTAFNVYRFTRRSYGEGEARAAAAVFVTSPMMVIMGGTYMNHMPTAWLLTSALAALPLWISASDPSRLRNSAAVIGAGVGAALTIRPVDAVVAGAVFGLTMLFIAARAGTRERVPSILVAIGVGAVPTALLLLANWKLTGHPMRFGYEVLWGPNHSLGLHADPIGNPHTPWRALLLSTKYLTQMNWIATSWPVPVLLIVAAGLMLARGAHRWDKLLLVWFVTQLLVYGFYWHDGQFVGPRFIFTVIPALLILAARMPFIASEKLTGVPRRVALAVIPVCIGVAWLRSMPPFGVQAIATEFRETRTRLKVDPPREVETGAVRNALIFVQEGASTRLLHRLWGLGISRPSAARLLADADGCSLFDAVRAEERIVVADTAERLRRIRQSVRLFERKEGNLVGPDASFRILDSTTVTGACRAEIAHDTRINNSIAYGPMLLLNEIEGDGRVGGPAIYVIDLRERNEVLRDRFRDRSWYRYEVPFGRPDSLPVLVPYPSAR